MDNRLYEFGGTADVLIKCKSPRTIDGVEYKEGEPYTMLKDVVVQLKYEQRIVEASGVKPVFSGGDGRPYEMVISSIPLTRKIANLILTSSKNEYCYTKKEIITCWEEGKLELSDIATNDKIFCYDVNFDVVEAQLENGGKIISGNFKTNVEYLVFYTVLGYGNAYSFEVPYYAYFSIEIFAKGNSDKCTNNVYMNFDAAALTTVPDFNLLNGGLLNTPLVFKLIYKNQKEPIVVFD